MNYSTRLMLILCTGVIILPGCTLYQKPEVPVINHPEEFKVNIKKDEFPELNDRWWENFNNPQLNKLVEQSIKHNYSYQVALTNIDIAQTYVDISMTGLFPLVGGDFSSSRNKRIVNVGTDISSAPQLTTGGAGLPFNLNLITATAAYEIDVWNSVHNAVDQAKSNKLSVEGNTNVVRLTLISSVVNTYYEIMALSQDIQNLKKQLKAAREMLALFKIQYQSGLIDESQVYLASTELENISNTLNLNKKQKEILEYGLAYLIGEYPENFSIKPEGHINELHFAQLIPEGIPSHVIGMRPDVQSDLGQILAFGYLQKQDIAAFLPNFTMTSSYGYASNVLSQLIKNSNVLWNYGINVAQTFFNYPALISQYQQAKLQYQSAVYAYQNTVQNAFFEVDSALVSYQKDSMIMHSLRTEQENANELFKIAKAKYHAGLTDYTDYLTNNINELQSTYNLTNQQLVVVQDIIQAYKSMGLGVQPTKPVESDVASAS
ncbi:MAG: efflux transporter outer membrane subunit [Gammaproteobacteria bacterium]